VETPFEKDAPHVSPDGRWIAYNSNESGRWEVFVAAFPGFTDKRQVSNGGGVQPVWRKDGKELGLLRSAYGTGSGLADQSGVVNLPCAPEKCRAPK